MAIPAAFASALLVAVAMPNWSWWPLVFVALVPLLAVARRVRGGWRTFVAVLIGTAPVCALQNNWAMSVTGFGYPLMVLYLSLYPAVFVAILQRLRDRVRVPWTIIVPVVWVGLECIRGRIVFGGYGWMLLGHPLVDWSAGVQASDIFGSYGISLLVAGVNGAIADAMVARTRRPKWRNRAIGALVVLWAASIAYGTWRVNDVNLTPGPAALVVQTDLPQNNKVAWTIKNQQKDVRRWLDLTVRGIDGSPDPIDFIVWPETMLPGVGFDDASLDHVDRFGELYAHLTRWPRAARAAVDQWQIPWLVGTISWDDSNIELNDDGSATLSPGSEFNSAVLVAPGVMEQRWDKRVLTPFGETMPYISAWPWLEQQLLSLGAKGMSFKLSPGRQPLAMELPRGEAASIRIATPICYENLVSNLVREMVWDGGTRRADLLVNLSNDGWYGESIVSRAHQCQVARMRCIENRTPMIRAVNTGFSICIDPLGNVAATIGEGRYGDSNLEAAARFETRTTDAPTPIYAHIGDLVAWLALIGLILLLLLGIVHRPAHERRGSSVRTHARGR